MGFNRLGLVLMMCGLCVLLSRPLGAAEELTPSGAMVAACPAAGAVAVDGRLNEPAWALAVTGSEFRMLGTTGPAPRPTTFKVLYTADSLLIGVEVYTGMGGRRATAKPAVKEHDGPVFSDESVEIYVQPSASGPYYHFAANAAGVQ